MFDGLTERLNGVFDTLTGRGALTEKDVEAALREVRVALLEADVALPVVKKFVAKVKIEAIGERVIRSVAPGQQVVKIVHDELVELLGGAEPGSELDIQAAPPAVVMMAGLQGSGKTTTTAKLARRLRQRMKKKVLVASLDTRRPAAMEQLQTLASQAEVDCLPIIKGQTAVDIAKRALNAAKLGGHDVLILDTAGRTTLDEDMMSEAASIAAVTEPAETLLVADALTGQDAVETAKRFNARLKLTGLVLTRLDGDGRGGAALSMRSVTGLPVRYAGVGEKLDGLEVFDAQRVAGRILGQGDVVSLVEKAAAEVDQDKAEKLAAKMQKGQFDLADMADQLRQLQKMGGLGGMMGLLPGMGKMKKQIDAMGGIDDRELKRQEAIILSMTPAERRKPDILKASRKRRIAAGAGVQVADVNKLLKMHRQMADMVKAVGKGKMKGLANLLGGGGPGGGPLPPGGAGGLPGLGGPGLGGSGMPGLGGPLGPNGLPPGFGKK
ncbi:MAG: signal recognition particle protein [Maricaulaceae bacterium]